MPDQEQSRLEQQAYLWPFLGTYDGYGRPQVAAAPIIIQVAWRTVRRLTLDPKSDTIQLDAEAIVDRRIDCESLVWLASGDPQGTQQPPDWFGTGSGSGVLPDTELMQVKSYNEYPDIRARAATKVIGMVRFRGHP